MDKDQHLIYEAMVDQIGGLTMHRGASSVDILLIRDGIGFVYSGNRGGQEMGKVKDPSEWVKTQSVLFSIDHGDIVVYVLEASSEE